MKVVTNTVTVCHSRWHTWTWLNKQLQLGFERLQRWSKQDVKSSSTNVAEWYLATALYLLVWKNDPCRRRNQLLALRQGWKSRWRPRSSTFYVNPKVIRTRTTLMAPHGQELANIHLIGRQSSLFWSLFSLVMHTGEGSPARYSQCSKLLKIWLANIL
jgi:hypothetical protein